MSLYAAIDLHSSNSVLAVMDGDGKPALRCRRPNDLPNRRATQNRGDVASAQPRLAAHRGTRYPPGTPCGLSTSCHSWSRRLRNTAAETAR